MKKIIIILGLSFLTISTFAQDIPLKRLYLGNDTHMDLMYNGTEEKWSKLVLEMTDFYLNLGESTIKEEPAKRSKWNYDCAYWLWVLERQTSPEYFKRVIAQIKNQQASVPYNFTLPIYGASSAESVLRSFYYGGYLERKYGIDVDIAVCQENATIPLGLPSLFYGSGAKYSWKGVCNCASKTLTKGTRKHEMYWLKGLDDSPILMKWYSNYGWNAELGGYAEILEPTVAVIQMDTLCGSKRYPYRIAGAFGRGWDNMVNYAYDMAWGVNHRTRPGTKLFLSNELDFFKDFEDNYGKQLPSQTLAYGNEWDLLPATMMNVSGSIRRSMEKLRTAEAMASVIVSQQPKAFDHFKKLKDDAMYAISVISAHGWTIDGPIKKPQFAEWARIQEKRIALYVDSLYDESAQILGNKIMITKDKKQFYVFNSLNWSRTDITDIKYDNENISVKDAVTGKKVAHQFMTVNNQKYLRILATDIPSVGYKCFEILDNQNTNTGSKNNFLFNKNQLTTPFYTVQFSDAGAIISLKDRKTGKEYVGKSLNVLGDASESIVSIESQGAVSMTIKIEKQKPVRHTSHITFFSNISRIDIKNEINQNFGKPTYWTYNFNVENPEIWHEEVGAVVKAKYETEGGHYANEMSRVDHLSLNHFVDVSNAQGGVTLSDLDCLFMKVGKSEPQKLDQNSSEINVLAGGQIDANFNLGIINQAGDSLFHQHLALFPHSTAYSQTSAMKNALEHQNPFVAGVVKGGNDLPEKQFSFLQTDNQDLLIWALKPGEESGLAVRFWNMSNKPVEAKLSFTKQLKSAKEATHVETPVMDMTPNDNSLIIKQKQQQMKTFLVEF